MTLDEQYAIASPEQKRVMIAQDIIYALTTDRYRPSIRAYVNIIGNSIWKEQAKEVLRRGGVPCMVCGIGALFCSIVRFENEMTLEQVDDARFGLHPDETDKLHINAREVLGRHFDDEQQQLVEAYYMGNSGYIKSKFLTEKHKERIHQMSNKSVGDKLVLIARNIINNNGTFIPENL